MVARFMRTTVDIPDPLYRELNARAARQGRPVKELILQGVAQVLREPQQVNPPRLKYPILRAGKPGSLKINNKKIYDLIGFS